MLTLGTKSKVSNVSINYDAKKLVYTIYGVNFNSIVRYIYKHFLGKKIDYIFKKRTNTELSFYSYFAYELVRLLEKIIENNPRYNINMHTVLDMIETLKMNTWVKNVYLDTTKSNYDYNIIKNKMNFKILPHQKEAIEEYRYIKNKLDMNGFLLHAEPGSGKTFMSLAISELEQSHRVIIVCPLPTVDKVWMHSLTNEIYKTEQSVYKYSKTFKYNNEKFIVVHYEALDKIVDIYKELKTTNTTIILDESHNFNEVKSSRVSNLLELIKLVEPNNVILLSGTPVKGISPEIGTLISFIDPKVRERHILERVLKAYSRPSKAMASIISDRYGHISKHIKKESLKLPELRKEDIEITIPNGKDYTLDTIKDEMIKYYKTRLKELEDKKEYYVDTYNRLYNKAKNIALTNGDYREKEFKEYENNFNKVITAYESRKLMFIPETLKAVSKFEKEVIEKYLHNSELSDFREAKTIVKYLELKIQGEVLGNVLLKKRIECHRDMILNVDIKKITDTTIKKTIIFTNYIEVAEAAKKKAIKDKLKPITVYGNNTKDLTSTVTSFTKNKSLNPLVATYKSLSTGVPITIANVILLVDLPFREYILNQAISRAWRLGQDKPVTAYILKLNTGDEKNINDRNIDIIQFYKDNVKLITGRETGLDIDYKDKDLALEELSDIFNIDKSILTMLLNKVKLGLDSILNVESKKNVLYSW